MDEQQPVTADQVAKAYQDNKLAQVLYHDWEAGTYDEKWSISFDQRCIDYARDVFLDVLGPVRSTEQWPYGRTLEIGAGTGFFALNLRQAGALDHVTVTDLSPGMVEAAQENARRLGFEVDGAVADVEALPFPDDELRPRDRPRRAPPPARRRGVAARGAAGAASRRPVRDRGRAHAGG